MPDLFKKRTASIFHGHKRRARKVGKALTYSLDEFREFVRQEPLCWYCQVRLRDADFCIDHDTPVSRGGDFGLDNLAVCCALCNRAKGILSGDEFADLLRLVDNWPPGVKRDLLARLRAGAKIVGRGA